MKKLRLGSTMAGPEGVHLKGTLITVDDETAEQLIANHGAVYVGEGAEPETADAVEPEQATSGPQRKGVSKKTSGRR